MGLEWNLGKHNGWTNYETWAVKAWLDNEPELHERFLAIVQNPDSSYQQAEDLQEWIRIDRDAQEEDISLDGCLVGMYTDLVTAALDNVNWREIIESEWPNHNPNGGR